MTDESPDKEIRHIVADSIGGVNYCPDCGSELDVNMDWDDIAEYNKECPECGKQYLHHEIEYLVEVAESMDPEDIPDDTSKLLKSDIVEADEDIDILRLDVDLRMERLSDKSVFVAGYGGGDNGEIDYRYWFNVDEGQLSIKREIIRDTPDLSDVDIDKDVTDAEDMEKMVSDGFDEGDAVREKSDYDSIENSIMEIAREAEDTNTGETLYYLTHQSSNPDSRLITEEELEERYERVE